MNAKELQVEETLEKLGAILRTIDAFEIPEWDKSALIWIACEYLEKLEEVFMTGGTQ